VSEALRLSILSQLLLFPLSRLAVAMTATSFNSFPVAAGLLEDGDDFIIVFSFNSFPVAAGLLEDGDDFIIVFSFNSFPVAAWAAPRRA